MNMMRGCGWVCVVLVVAACGEVENGACDAGASDALAPDASALDAPAPEDATVADACVGAPDAAVPDAAPPCVWGSISPVAELNTGDPEVGPALSADGLTVYFARRPGSAYQIFTASRPTTSLPFGTTAVVPELDTTGDDVSPFLAGSGLEIYWTSKDASDADIWRGTRSMPSGAFTATATVATLNSGSEDERPRLSPDGLTVYFASDRPGGMGGLDIYRATRPDLASEFGLPSPVGELNSSSDEMGGTFTPDGATFYFASNRPGTIGAFDIMRASHAGGVFGTPEFVAELNSATYDIDPFIASDGTLYFASDRSGSPGNHDIFTASCP